MSKHGTCVIDGCDRDVMYPSRGICQMHYFRHMRTGSYERKERSRKLRLENPAGYQKLLKPEHPLADSHGYVYEHRFVVYEAIGEDMGGCAICGKAITWKTCHIDHIDENVRNNAPSNLRATCRWCNTSRGRKAEHEYDYATGITMDGVTMTPTEWARQSCAAVNAATIRRRFKAGWPPRDAICTPSKTFRGKDAA